MYPFLLKKRINRVKRERKFYLCKNGMLGKQLAINEIPREMNTAEYWNQHLSLGRLKFMFFLKLVTKKPGLNEQL